MINAELSKEAGVLRTRLQKGLIDINELISFLAKVENNSPPAGKDKKTDRFQMQLENLNRGRAKKPRLPK